MLPRKFRASLLGFGLASLVFASALAGPKLDLNRVAPVPATEPIPTMDFFRPKLLSEPVLSPSGTHIAAIITAGEDKHELMVYRVRDRTVDVVGGAADKDIYNVHWLDD